LICCDWGKVQEMRLKIDQNFYLSFKWILVYIFVLYNIKLRPMRIIGLLNKIVVIFMFEYHLLNANLCIYIVALNTNEIYEHRIHFN
jgi:hypothetical protein